MILLESSPDEALNPLGGVRRRDRQPVAVSAVGAGFVDVFARRLVDRGAQEGQGCGGAPPVRRRISKTIRTARSRGSSGYFLGGWHGV
ncbi:hypothetical protein [Streptosporangium sandarakinum]|uniref:hypothetical protein n=1 Tax=Streptosporangium sandarakinum TaxID=1260955 RepID=UPI00371F23AC